MQGSNVKTKIVISLIHNNEEERLSYIRPYINDLIVDLENNFDVKFCEISYQPNLKPVSLRVGFSKDLTYWKLNREWSRYRKMPNRFFLYDFLLLIFKITKKYVFNPNLSKSWRWTCAVESAVSNKHIKAFHSVLENEADYLLIFENDAIFKNDSINNISNLINNLELNKQNSNIYIDLGGGYKFEELKISKLEVMRDDKFRYYLKPVTNTACCYLIDQQQAKIFCSYLADNSKLCYLGIDWLMNKLFMMQFKNGVISTGLHADPHFLEHGSFTGKFKSWK